jgi:CheY-like chemotaxis protein
MNAEASVLVVEDDDDTREVVVYVLETAGYRVVTATNGQLALDVLRSSPHPLIVVLDMMMPVMDGWQFLAVLRASGELPKVPVIVVSASHGEHLSATGVRNVLRKPIDMPKLLSVIEECRLAV